MSNPGRSSTARSLPDDEYGALIVGPEMLSPGANTGALVGRTFVAKDLFDVADYPTGAGNPDWLDAAPRADEHATTVESLVRAGASLIGKAHTDELAFSLSGRNLHYGTPTNPRAPGRLPGGSSSGPAVAVAAGLSDLGLGSDTGGSIRVPASYCGILGFRPTHGRVSLAGAVALAPSFDTAGLFSRTGGLLRDGMLALLDPRPPSGGSVTPIGHLLLATDAMLQLDVDARETWERAVHTLGLPVKEVTLCPEGGLDDWRVAFQILQSSEAWTLRRTWFEQSPSVAPDVEGRFRSGGRWTQADLDSASSLRERVGACFSALFGPGDAIVVPSACGVAPLLDLAGTSPAMDDVRCRTLNLTCTAGLAGAPALSLPVAEVDRSPVGVCIVGLPGQDEALLDLAARVIP